VLKAKRATLTKYSFSVSTPATASGNAPGANPAGKKRWRGCAGLRPREGRRRCEIRGAAGFLPRPPENRFQRGDRRRLTFRGESEKPSEGSAPANAISFPEVLNRPGVKCRDRNVGKLAPNLASPTKPTRGGPPFSARSGNPFSIFKNVRRHVQDRVVLRTGEGPEARGPSGGHGRAFSFLH